MNGEKKPFIVFEGPIAAGKTTMAGIFARKNRLPLLEENFADNEFLPDFYIDRNRWALSMQLWFLVERHKQMLNALANGPLGLVADYSPNKNDIFAGLLLADRELSLFKAISCTFGRAIQAVDLFVYLDAEDGTLLKRIKSRGRSYESYIDDYYLDSVRSAYEASFTSLQAKRIFRVDTTRLDLQSETELERFCDSVEHAAHSAMV